MVDGWTDWDEGFLAMGWIRPVGFTPFGVEAGC